MFSYLKILPQPALAQVTLSNLGRINVVCGKNNSGKSTLLRSIADPEKRVVGLELNQEKLLADVCNQFTLTSPRHSNFISEIQKILSHADGVWFADERMRFSTLIDKLYKDSRILKELQPRGDVFVGAYMDAFSSKTTTILVPPKRQLDVLSPVSVEQMPQPSGQGVVAQLFYGKNQPEADIDRKIHDNVLSAFRHITSGYEFGIFQNRNHQITLNFSLDGKIWVDAELCGLGLQDVLVMLFFAISPLYQVVIIEEPESHLHPDMQRRLLEFFKTETQKQYFLPTHSNVFLDAGFVDRVFFTKFTGEVTVDDATTRAALLSDLGYAVTDNLVSDLIILVEGVHDVTVLEEYLIKMGVYGKYNIKFWRLGGDIMDRHDLEVFAQNYKIIALIDQDPKSDAIRRRFIANCERLGIPATRLKRYAMENYYTVRALREVFEGQISEDLTEIAPLTKLKDQINIDVKGNSRKLAKAMTMKELQGSDDLWGFLQAVKVQCEQAN